MRFLMWKSRTVHLVNKLLYKSNCRDSLTWINPTRWGNRGGKSFGTRNDKNRNLFENFNRAKIVTKATKKKERNDQTGIISKENSFRLKLNEWARDSFSPLPLLVLNIQRASQWERERERIERVEFPRQFSRVCYPSIGKLISKDKAYWYGILHAR